VPIELAGAVDEQALRMVVRMIADSAAR